MTDSISFGKGKNAGKVDLNKVKEGLTKQQIAGNNKKLQSIFDKVDKSGNGILEQDELMEFQKELSDLAGDDNQLTDKEAKGFKDAGGHKMGRRHRKAFYEFLNKLAANEQEPQAAQLSANAIEVQPPKTDAAALIEEQQEIQTTVAAQNADEIVPDSETKEDDAPATISEQPAAETEAEEEPEVTTGIIVQNGESPAAIAKKFGVPLQELLDANQGQLKGKGKNKYFVVGAEIVIPKKYSDEELAALTAGRKSAAEANADYAHQAAIRQQRREQQKAQMEALGVVNRKGAGTVVNAKTKATEDGKFANFNKNPEAYKKMTYTVVGETGNRGRMIVKASNGKYYTMAKDGLILKETYAKATKAYDAGKAQARNDGRGRQVVVVDGQEYIFSKDGKLLKSSHVQITDAKDAGKASKTASGNQTSFVKGQDGKVSYFDKNGQLITGEQRKQLVRAEAEKIADIIYKSAAGMGTDEDKLAQGVNMIYSPEVMSEVNAILKTKHKDYAGTTQTTPLEALLLDELSRSEVRAHIQTLAKNGAYGTGEAKDAALGRNAAREIQYEVHGGVFGYTSTKDLNEAMNVASTRGARIETEEIIKDKVKGGPNDGSYVRQYIAEDDLGIDWSAQEIDQFDANWVKNGAYDHEHDQDHRNAVTGRLVFEYGNKESLHKGLEAIDTESADYTYVSTRAAEANQANGYQAHFKNQDALQTYIAGRATDENNKVETPEVSACNTLLYKGEKPVRIQAEEALYDAKSGDFSTMFNSMDSKVYTEMATMLADGEVSGCKNMQEAYDKALNGAKTSDDKTTIKANAILSGQIEFSDKEIADFCVELMHNIDKNRGSGASTGVSAKYTNTADYMTAQLKAILQANPQVIAAVTEQVENGKFESTSTITSGGATSGGRTTMLTTDNKEEYLAIIKDSKYVANDIIFLDKDGNKITNSEEIAAITNANMEALQGMRDYVAELEREFKKGVDAEGGLSNMANGLMTYAGIGTDRDDVATQYRNAKIMLAQLEAAAQGKLRDSEGNVVSAQDLAQKFIETQDKLAQTNSDYQSSIQMTKMGIVLAPVIVVTTVASGGTNLVLGEAAAATTVGTIVTSTVAGTAAGLTTYGLNAYEYHTSLTGNTAEAREQNAIDSAITGVSTGIGFGQMKPIMGMGNNLNTIARTTTRLATTVASDVTVGAAGEYVATGNVSAQGTLMNMAFSAVPNVLGAKQFSHKTNIHPTGGNKPQVEINNHPSHDAEVVNNALHNEHVEADHHAGYARKRQQEADKLAVDMDPEQNVVTPEQQAAYDKEIAYEPVPEADRPAFDAHQQQVAADYAEAHELGNMVDASSADALQRAKSNIENGAHTPETPVTPAPKTANEEAIEKLTQSLADIDAQIARAESNLASKARRGKQPTLQEKQQLERMKSNRAEKQAELDALQRPAAEPEVVVRADDAAEAEVVIKPDEVADGEGVVISADEDIIIRANADEAAEAGGVVVSGDQEIRVRNNADEPVVTPQEVPTPESIAHDAQSIPAAAIPAEHRSLWKSCQERINKIFSGAGKLAKGEVKTVLEDIKTLCNAVKDAKIKTQLKKLYNKVVAYAKSKQASKPAVADTPAPVRNLKEMNPIEQSQSFNRTHKIDSETRVADGYKDGGRGLRFDDNGNPINTPSREIILVDRQQDKQLQDIIADFKKKTANMSEKKKAAFLQKYVYEISGGKHIKDAAMDAFDSANTGKEVLLGDIITAQPPVAVCRHRSLLYKILGDEVGLKVELQRGNFYDQWGGGGHAWNTVQFEDGTSAIFDAMHNKSSNVTPGHVDDYAKKYFSVKDEDLYSNGLNNRPVNNGEIEVIAVESPVIEPEIQIIPDFSNAKAGDRLPVEADIIVAQDAKLNLANQFELDLSAPEVQARLQDGKPHIVGREGDIPVSNDLARVSRRHLEIQKVGDNIIVRDISSNGTTFASKAAPQQNPQVRNQVARELPDINPDELCRNVGNNGRPVDPDYIRTSQEARVHLNDAIESGQYTESLDSYIQTMNRMHEISYNGFDQTHEWYSRVGNGGMPVNPGKIRKGQPHNGRYREACEIEAIAKQYGDPYRVNNEHQRVDLDGIPKKHQPFDINNEDMGYRHFYPDGSSLEKYYYKEMHRTAKEAVDLINRGASERQILDKLAEHYQYAANARPYGQINNSLFMNEVNTLLLKAGMKPMPQGALDHAAMRLQPKAFKKYFADEYTRTALDTPSTPQPQAPKAQAGAPAAAPCGLSPEQKAMVGEIGDAINRAKNNHSLDQAQAKIDRLPDSPEKNMLQRQANEKSRELRRMEEPIPTPHRETSEEPYFVDVSDQAGDNLLLLNKNGEYNISAKEINNKIETASTEIELDAIQKKIDQIEDCQEKFELQRKLDKKRQELDNNIVIIKDIEEINPTYGNNENGFNEAILLDEMEHYNNFNEEIDLADDIGGFDPF